MKHTPGPWQARGSRIANDFGIVVEGQYVIAEAFSDIRQAAKTDIEEARANARLIAAAPDLLEALREVCLQFLQRGVTVDPEHPDHVALKNAEAAIAKATGSTA